jgi:YVTN family beta-propeller protein
VKSSESTHALSLAAALSSSVSPDAGKECLMQRSHLALTIVFAAVVAALPACGSHSTTPPVNPTPTPIAQERLFVSEGNLNQIAVLDATTGTQIAAIPVGKTPTKLSYSAGSHSLWVANAGDNTVMKIDTDTLKVVGKVTVGSDPEWVDASEYRSANDDVVDVANRGSKTITQLHGSNLSVIDTISTSGAPLSIDSFFAMVAEDNGRLVLFENSPPSLNSTAAFTVANGLQGAAHYQDFEFNDYILAYTANDGKVSEYKAVAAGANVSGLSPVGTYQLPAGAGQIYNAGSGAIVVNDVTNQLSYIDLRESKVEFTTKVGTAPGGAGSSSNEIYVANRGDDTVSVLSVFTGAVKRTFRLAAGAHPEDVAYQYAEIAASPAPKPTATPTPAPTATPTPVPTSTPASTQHLYVANGSAKNVLVYTSPFSALSAPSVNVNIGEAVWGVASDSQYVAVEDNVGFIYIFAQPLTSGASPVAQFQGGAQAGQLYFDSNGNLYTGDESIEVLQYSPPFTNTSTPAKVINGTTASFSLTMDYKNNLYTGDLGMNQIEIFASPYTGSPTQVAQPGTYGLASYATYLYGADAGTGKIDVYNLPMSASSTPAFSISNTDPHALAADISTGTLYVGDQHGGGGSGSIDVYNQPLSSASTAAYSISSGVSEPVQVWIGP